MDAGALWDHVAEAAHTLHAQRILLLGHVPEADASALADLVSIDLLTIDLFSDLAPARDSRNRRLVADFAFPTELDFVFETLGPLAGPTLLVAMNLLEHLADPRPALAFMRRILLAEPTNALLLASPDRAMTAATAETTGLRSWSRAELMTLLSASGFHLSGDAPTHVQIGLGADRRSDTLLLAHCTVGDYNGFLRAHGLPYAYDPPAAIHLVLTDEHAKILPINGGIGSYVEDLEALSDNVFVAFNRGPVYHPADFSQGYRCLHPRLFWDDEYIGQFAWEDMTELSLLLIQQILFYYPNIASIEYQECNGHGARLAAAKRAGMLPDRILLIARCHGSQIYLEVGFQQWLPATSSHSRLMILEKSAIELADIVSIPSRYLRDLYVEYGVDIDPRRLRMEPYAHSIRMELSDIPYRPVDTLVFFGRRQLHKGFAEFLDTLACIDFSQSTIRKIIIFGARVEPTVTDDAARIAKLRKIVEIEECISPRGELHARLLALAPNALILMPYRADNAPLSIYEVLSAGCQFLAADRGGIPELIPQPFHGAVLLSIDPHIMAARINTVCQLDGEQRKAMVAALQAATRTMLAASRTSNLATIRACYRHGSGISPRRLALSAEMLTAAVPMFNPTPQELRDLCDGLNAQTLRPQEVIFVDDGSDLACRRQAEAIVADNLQLPYRFIGHDINRGLAAARNTALEATRTKYFLPMDVDNIPLADHFRRLVHAMEYDPQAWATTSYMQLFTDRVDWRDLSAVLAENYGKGVCYRPLGAGIIDSLMTNNLGDAHGCYRVEPIRQLGGWDTLGRAKWEDWAMYLRILSHRGRVLVVPSPDYLYRTRTDSMERTYPTFPAERLQARALDLLPRFERYRLIALSREVTALRTRIAVAAVPLRHRVANRLLQLLNRAPHAKPILMWVLRTTYRAARGIKRRILAR